MNAARRLLRSSFAPALASLLCLLGGGAGCAPASMHPVVPAALGRTASEHQLAKDIDVPGPVTVETIDGAAWEVDRGGLINLDSTEAKAAGLQDGLEPIHIYAHAFRHPTRGTFLIDTGVEKAYRDAPDKAAIQGLVAKVAHTERIKVVTATGDWLAAPGREPLVGVFLTHLHVDHVTGLPDVPRDVPVYVGPGEARASALDHLFTADIVDRGMSGRGPFLELSFGPDPDGVFEGIRDLFGDGTVWALYTPGHTAGSTSFAVRTPQGPVLLTGDACHTRWGWDHAVEPGAFSSDRPRSRKSLLALKAFAAKHPAMIVKLGHQR
jgi:glyoxylase-like metal-dependent hydrolase (beta-lactamase superfamily II)